MAALALRLPSFFAVVISILAVVAFSGATHDIAADGVSMSELSTSDQAKYIGIRGAFNNLAKLVATGGLVWLAGWLFERFWGSGLDCAVASRTSRSAVLLILAAIMAAAGLWHVRSLSLWRLIFASARERLLVL